MQDKPKSQFTICPIATANDINTTIDNLNDEIVIKQLNELSLARFHYFKNYLIEQFDISSARILFCTPQIDHNATGQARLTFTS